MLGRAEVGPTARVNKTGQRENQQPAIEPISLPGTGAFHTGFIKTAPQISYYSLNRGEIEVVDLILESKEERTQVLPLGPSVSSFAPDQPLRIPRPQLLPLRASPFLADHP